MYVLDVLNRDQVTYDLLIHSPAYTAQQIAQQEHIHGMNVAKPVVVYADDNYYMCVLPACCRIDFCALRSVLEANEIRLATEVELAGLCMDCEIGAEPPLGSLYGIPTIMDDRLENDDFIVFQGGRHDRAIKLNMDDFLKVESPRIFSFSYHI